MPAGKHIKLKGDDVEFHKEDVSYVLQVHRQDEPAFIHILHKFREGVFQEQDITWIERNCATISTIPTGTPVVYMAPLNKVRPWHVECSLFLGP